MSDALDALPDDVATLKRLLIGRDEMIAKLVAEIARLKRWRFGRSAERIDPALMQLQLALGELLVTPVGEVADQPVPAPEDSTRVAPAHGARRRSRAPRALPAHLPRETIVHAPASCTCPDCGGWLRKLGEDISELLDFIPGYFKVIRHVRPKLSCAHCARVIQLPAPTRPLERALPAAGLLTQVIVAKYADHCPLYRQAAIYRRCGVDLDRATLAEWVGGVARLVAPLVEVLGRYVLAADKVHADDTPVPVLEPGRGQTKTGRLWTYVRDDRPAGSRDPPAVWYRYSPDRKSEHPRAHLRHFRGILQADAYSGFGALYDSGDIVEASCWAHARRKFYDIYMANRSPIAGEAIARIGALYAIERDIHGRAPEQRALVRQREAAPCSIKCTPGSQLHCVRYRPSRISPRPSTTRSRAGHNSPAIATTGASRSTTTAPSARSAHWYWGGATICSPARMRVACAAANIYSLVGTALLNAMDPYLYLRHVLERIADHPINRIEELLPWNVAANAPVEARQAA